MNKEYVKYGLMIAAAYLVYKYVQDHGGFDAMLGMSPAMPSLPLHTGAPVVPASAPAPAQSSGPTPPPAALDVSGLVVTKDVNNAFTGTVRINGTPQRLAIIQTDGRIFNSAGQEVTDALIASGVNVAQLRQAFTTAGAGLGIFAPFYRGSTPIWLN